MYNYSYKKNKLEQLRGFCAVVECGTIIEAAKRLNLSASSISLQISSLEQDLKVNLFDKVGRNLKLNAHGKAYYIKAKEALTKIEEIYNKELILRISKIEILLNRIRKRLITMYKAFSSNLAKISIKITFKKALIFVSIIATSIWFYLHETNWFFDQKLHSLANPLLKEVMNAGYSRIEKDYQCESFGAQFNEDIANLLLKLKNNTISATVSINECPSQAIRITGDDNIDKAMHNKKAITCRTDEGYQRLQTLSKLTKDILIFNKNFKIYTIYTKTDCINHNVFEGNMIRYQGQILAKKISTLNKLNVGRFWLIKYRNYYYLMIHTNGLQGHIEHLNREHYLIYKKLTLNKLMHYDNSSYWKIIKDYNIKID